MTAVLCGACTDRIFGDRAIETLTLGVVCAPCSRCRQVVTARDRYVVLRETTVRAAELEQSGGSSSGDSKSGPALQGRNVARVDQEHPVSNREGLGSSPSPQSSTPCVVCGSTSVTSRHCKLVCDNCGATRDCSDP